MKKSSIIVLAICLVACTTQNNKNVVNLEYKEIKYKEVPKETLYINGEQVSAEVEKHGDHYHIIYEGKSLAVTKSQLEKMRHNENIAQSTAKVVNVYKHGDHYHVELSDGSSYITYENPLKQNITKIETINNVTKIIYNDGRSEIASNVQLNNMKKEKINYETTKLFEKVFKHDDHVHVTYQGKEYIITLAQYEQAVKDNEFHTNKEEHAVEDVVDYISEFYGIQKDLIKIEDDVLIFPHDDHYHSINIHDVIIPKKSDDIEQDFENELENLAKMTKTPIDQIIIEDGYMKIVHGDHTHDYKIKSTGWRLYLKNKIPPIDSEYIEGTLDRQMVLEYASQLKNKAQQQLHTQPKKLKRVLKAINNFEEDLAWASNSTEGYIQALKKFEKQYIIENDTTENNEVYSYAQLQQLIETALSKLSEDTPNYMKIKLKLQELEKEVSFRVESQENLTIQWNTLKKDLIFKQEETTKDEFTLKYEEVYQKIKQIDEATQLSKKISLLNLLYDAKTIEALIRIEENMDSTLNHYDKRQELIEYIQANNQDARLTESQKQQLVVQDNMTINQLEKMKEKIKQWFKSAEENENKFLRLGNNLVVEIKTLLQQVNDEMFRENLLESINMLQEELKTKQDKESVYQELVSARNHIQVVIAHQEENTESIVDNQNVNVILAHINNNRRNIDLPIKEKVRILNEIDEIENSFNKNALTEQQYQKLLQLKEEIDAAIVVREPVDNGW